MEKKFILHKNLRLFCIELFWLPLTKMIPSLILLGTGTTAVVSKKLGRKYYGIERDKKYFKAAIERVNKTKVIEEDYLDTIENSKSKPRIPFGSLVEIGILKPGATLDSKMKINAKIMADGSIKYKKSEGSIHKSGSNNYGR